MKTLKFSFLSALFLLSTLSPDAFAATVEEPVFYAPGNPEIVSRGEGVAQIVDSFGLEKRERIFLGDCMKHMADCFFVFSAMSDYDDIRFYPLILYPDVFPAHKDYKAINTASMLGLVHGYLEEESSPFHPEKSLTRIQALKVVLGAADLLQWKEKFELSGNMGVPEESPFEDVPTLDSGMWWYPRYLHFALDAGIIPPDQNFRPDEPISQGEFTTMIAQTIAYSQRNDKKAFTSENSIP